MLKLLWVMVMKCHHYVEKMWDHCFYLKAMNYYTWEKGNEFLILD